jgi:acyl-CoA thioesterase FadM
MHLIEIGTKSFQLGYEIYVGELLHTKGSSVLVCFNSVTHKTISVPDSLKVALKKLN